MRICIISRRFAVKINKIYLKLKNMKFRKFKKTVLPDKLAANVPDKLEVILPDNQDKLEIILPNIPDKSTSNITINNSINLNKECDDDFVHIDYPKKLNI